MTALRPYPAYKDSGIDWLGEVPEHWEVRWLGTFGRFFKGSGGTKADETDEGIPCVRYGDLYTRHQFHITESKACVAPHRAGAYTPVRYGDVLFAGSGETLDEIGKSAVNLIRRSAVCGGDVIVFRPTIDVDAEFIGWSTDCRQAAFHKARMGRGMTVMHIYSSDLKRLAVPLPPLPEQTAIARFLAHAGRRIRRYIRAKEKLISLLEEQKQAIIHEAVTGQIDVRTGQPYPAYQDSGVEWLGEVPRHWEVSRLGTIVNLTVGFPFKSEGFTQSDDDIRLLRGVNIAPGGLRWETVVRWSAQDVDSFMEYRLRVGDIVMGMDRPIIQGGTRVAVITPSDVPSLLLQRVARIRVGEALARDFAIALLGGKGFSDYLVPIFTGISVPHLSPEQIKCFRFALPSVSEQRTIMGHVQSRTDAIQSAIAAAAKQIRLLGEYRSRLIADVVTGKVDVREAAASLPDADSAVGTNQLGAGPAESHAHAPEYDIAKEAIP
ncbi:restriction endonuclease subunit S [Candidatus Palauibacter sp.]|uniref:restriction endonuclease subunit S n=1 Tax=Candidatus Palauibacter sp. TaxID=3101350 RepID=UPI003B59E28D